MRKRRRTKYTWFPNIGSAAQISTDPFSQLIFSLTVPANGDIVTAVSPLTIDTPLEGGQVSADDQLSEVLGNEYFIERVVGKFFAEYSAPADDPPTTTFPKAVLAAAGLFVARANDANSGGGLTTPIGSASVAELRDNYSPLSIDTVREPWMWRRTWILASGRTSGTGTTAQPTFSALLDSNNGNATYPPTQTMQYGSVLDGPHVDVKSVRRVRQDERLWLVTSVRAIDGEAGGVPANSQSTNGFRGVFDYRILGALRKAKAKSSF